MEKYIGSGNYRNQRNTAKLEYSKIKQIWCPVLNDHIVFSGAGFRHLIWKGDMMRFKSEQRRRFALIQSIPAILKNAERFVRRDVYSDGRKIVFWTFTDERNGKLIKVVIRQTEGQKKEFFSVFERNKKSTLSE